MTSKNSKRPNVTKLTRVTFRSSLTGFVLLLQLAFAFTDVAGGGRSKSQTLNAQEIFEAEQLLSGLGYWTGPVDGIFDAGSRHALVAFQKVEGQKRTGRLHREELGVLRTAFKPLPREVAYAHIEVDLQRQVLFVVDESGAVTLILPVCTGNEQTYLDHGQVHRAHTPRGHFTVTRKIRGFRLSSLGLLYYPNYIHEGIAIHGSWAMAVYPDSHGCIRIPMFAAEQFSDLVPIGTKVLVF